MSVEHFDAVIVGSGFGGSVTALRLAQAGWAVCLLERGRAYPPGSFPRSPFKLSRNFWDPSANLFGMFNVWSFRHIDALISSGLGGGSLIYANVLLRKDEKWFVKEGPDGVENWPVTRKELDPYYGRAERMLNAQPYPLGVAPFDGAAKTLAMREAAERLDQRPEYRDQLSWDLVPLAVSFRRRPFDPTRPEDPANPPVFGEPIVEDARNLHDQTRSTCRLCGECDIGCNYGSKNTLDFNYLSEARRLGAELRTLCEVKTFKPRERGGYTVDYVVHEPDPESPGKTPMTLTCDRLILAAGTLGTTFLLLKNAENLTGLNRQALGRRFSGNGDLLSFAVRARDQRGPRVLDGSFGPVITSALRMRDAADGGRGRGFYVEDAGYPDFVNWVVQSVEVPGTIRRGLRLSWDWVRVRLGLTSPDLSAEVSRLFGDSSLSKSSLPLLGMGRDVPDGRMRLDDSKRLEIDWKIDMSSDYFDRLKNTMRDMASVWGADFQVNPTYRLARRLITVHPLGGCPMADDPRRGVVDSRGRVFGCPGLYVADGSVMPGPVGANPSLTIAALAERSAEAMVEEPGPSS